MQIYIAAMPGCKQDIGERLDDLVMDTVPDVHKAVEWSQPFYGFEDEGWFLSFRCYTKYVQLQFLKETSLDPMPPKDSKHDEVLVSTSTRTTNWTRINSDPGSNKPTSSRTNIPRQRIRIVMQPLPIAGESGHV